MSASHSPSGFEKRWFKDSKPGDPPQKCWICGESLPGDKIGHHWTSVHPAAAQELDSTLAGLGKTLRTLAVALVLVPVAVLALYLLSVGNLSGGVLFVMGSSLAAVLFIAILYFANVVPARVIEKHKQLWLEAHPEDIPEKEQSKK